MLRASGAGAAQKHDFCFVSWIGIERNDRVLNLLFDNLCKKYIAVSGKR